MSEVLKQWGVGGRCVWTPRPLRPARCPSRRRARRAPPDQSRWAASDGRGRPERGHDVGPKVTGDQSVGAGQRVAVMSEQRSREAAGLVECPDAPQGGQGATWAPPKSALPRWRPPEQKYFIFKIIRGASLSFVSRLMCYLYDLSKPVGQQSHVVTKMLIL